jgi:regulator of sigma E protease
MKPFGPKPIPDHRWFESKPLIGRLFILIAGVTMNVILALVINMGTVAAYGRQYTPPVVDTVLQDRPAALAGLQRGDSVAAIDGAPVTEWQQLLDRVTVSPGRTLTLEVVRGGQRLSVPVRPEEREVQDELTGRRERVGRIGAGPVRRTSREPLAFAAAVAHGWDTTWKQASGIVDLVRGIFAGDVSTSTLGGPIAIAEVSVRAAKFGLETFLGLIALLSINVAVLNMLPVPILDGGQILLNILEAAKGSAFSERTREYILRVGLVAIALLFVLVMFNDIKGIVQRIL